MRPAHAIPAGMRREPCRPDDTKQARCHPLQLAVHCCPQPAHCHKVPGHTRFQAERGVPEWKLEQHVPQAINDGSEIEGRHAGAQRVIKELRQGWCNGGGVHRWVHEVELVVVTRHGLRRGVFNASQQCGPGCGVARLPASKGAATRAPAVKALSGMARLLMARRCQAGSSVNQRDAGRPCRQSRPASALCTGGKKAGLQYRYTTRVHVQTHQRSQPGRPTW